MNQTLRPNLRIHSTSSSQVDYLVSFHVHVTDSFLF